MAAVERGGDLRVARAEPRCVALRLREGVLGRLWQTERGIPEEVGRYPVRCDFGRVAEVRGDLLGRGPKVISVRDCRRDTQDLRLRR